MGGDMAHRSAQTTPASEKASANRDHDDDIVDAMEQKQQQNDDRGRMI